MATTQARAIAAQVGAEEAKRAEGAETIAVVQGGGVEVLLVAMAGTEEMVAAEAEATAVATVGNDTRLRCGTHQHRAT